MKKSRRQSTLNHSVKLSDSQNFITSSALIQRLLRLTDIHQNDTVIEIGTGKGHLTEALCRKSGQVYSVELDRKLYEGSKIKLAKYSNLRLVHKDFLKYSLPTEGDYKVFSNIPYCITTQIMEKLTGAPNPPKDIWLIMEKGAAKRFTGAGKETKQSLLLKVSWNMKILYHFHREDFHPMPSVDSVLVHFSRKAAPDLSKSDLKDFRRFVEQCFKYGIWGRNSLLTKRQVSTALKQAGLPHAHEDGVTLYIQWLCLFRCWKQQN